MTRPTKQKKQQPALLHCSKTICRSFVVCYSFFLTSKQAPNTYGCKQDLWRRLCWRYASTDKSRSIEQTNHCCAGHASPHSMQDLRIEATVGKSVIKHTSCCYSDHMSHAAKSCLHRCAGDNSDSERKVSAGTVCIRSAIRRTHTAWRNGRLQRLTRHTREATAEHVGGGE